MFFIRYFSLLLLLNLALYSSPLYDAIDSKNYKLAEKLLRDGSNPYEHRSINNKEQSINFYPYDAVCYVAAISNEKMLNIFLNHISMIDKECPTLTHTPLMSAVIAGNIKNVKLLLQKGANINSVSKGGIKPNVLMYAIKSNNNDTIKYLIQEGSNINYTTEYGFNSLTEAINQNNSEIATYLIQNGADIKGKIGFDALKYATTTLKYDFVRLLIENGTNINYKDKKGNTILHILASGVIDKNYNGLQNMLKHPIKGYPESYYKNIKKEVDNLKENWNNYSKIVNYLLKKGYKLDLTNSSGKTVKDIATENNTKIILDNL